MRINCTKGDGVSTGGIKKTQTFESDNESDENERIDGGNKTFPPEARGRKRRGQSIYLYPNPPTAEEIEL